MIKKVVVYLSRDVSTFRNDKFKYLNDLTHDSLALPKDLCVVGVSNPDQILIEFFFEFNRIH